MSDLDKRTTTRRTFLSGSIALGTLAVLTACAPSTPPASQAPASGGAPATGASPAAGGAPASTSAPAGAAASGSLAKTLRVGIPSDVLLTAVQRFNPNNQPLRRTVFDFLVDKNPDGTYKPSLASKFEWSSDKKSLVLTLRDGVTFHSGRAFGPDDVVANIEGALDAKAGVQVAALLKRASGTKKTGDNQVTVSFDTPFPAYLDALAALPIVDTQTFAAIADGKQVVGTGPFKWVSWTPGSKIELARNEKYWDSGKPSFETVTMNVITDAQAMLAAIRSGDLDLVNRMIPRDAATLKQDAKYSVSTTEGYDVYVGANVSVKPLDDVRVRQAIAYALDRKRIVDQVYSGLVDASCIPWSASTPGVTQEQVNHYAYNVEKAKALLKEAGAEGAEVALTSYVVDPAYGAIQQIAQYGLEQIGLKVKPVTYDAAQFPTHIQAGDFPGLWITDVALTVMGEVTALLTANPLRTDKNTHNFTPPEYKALVDKVVDAASDSDRAAANKALTDYMLQQAFHNTVVQARTPVVGVAGLSGVRTDSTLALILTDAKLTK